MSLPVKKPKTRHLTCSVKVYFSFTVSESRTVTCRLGHKIVKCIEMQMLPGQATKFGCNDRAVTPTFPYLLNQANDPWLPYFHYFFLMFHYFFAQYQFQCPCQTTLICLSFGRYLKRWSLPLYRRSKPVQWNEGTDESFVVTLTVK